MPLPAGHPPFSSLSSFRGVSAAKPWVYWLEHRFVIFAVFVKNPLFGGTQARFTKSTVSWTPNQMVAFGVLGGRQDYKVISECWFSRSLGEFLLKFRGETTPKLSKLSRGLIHQDFLVLLTRCTGDSEGESAEAPSNTMDSADIITTCIKD